MSDAKYPIGKFKEVELLDDETRKRLISEIEQTPMNLIQAIKGLDDEQLDTPYREGGWTVRQVVHHLADSHMNAYIRFKLAITENEPTIKPYEEAAWAELIDAKTASIEISLMLLDALHRRWILFLESLTPDDFKKNFTHPEHGKVNLKWALSMYSWHGRHHVAHITELRKKRNW